MVALRFFDGRVNWEDEAEPRSVETTARLYAPTGTNTNPSALRNRNTCRFYCFSVEICGML